jgi:hypothetical protein
MGPHLVQIDKSYDLLKPEPGVHPCREDITVKFDFDATPSLLSMTMALVLEVVEHWKHPKVMQVVFIEKRHFEF